MGAFMVALPISLCLGGPLSGWLLQGMDGMAGIAGWQWMLLVEGLPAVLLGLIVLGVLSDSIDHARWLSTAEKHLLKSQLDAESQHKTSDFKPNMR